MKGRTNTCDAAHDIIAKLRRMPALLTVREAAKVTHKHPETIYKMIHDNRIPAFLDGARWKIDPSRIAEWLELRSTQFKPAPTQTPEKPTPKRPDGVGHNGAPAVEPDGAPDGGVRVRLVSKAVARTSEPDQSRNQRSDKYRQLDAQARANRVPNKRDFRDVGDNSGSILPQVVDPTMVTPFYPYVVRVCNPLQINSVQP